MEMIVGGPEAGFGFESITDNSELVRVLSEKRLELAGMAETVGGVALMRAYSDLTDALVRRIIALSTFQAESGNPSARHRASRDIAILAVGGYGRREMSPHSDVDVTFVVGGEEDDEIDNIVKRAFRMLMDVLEEAHLKVGYSYRRVDDVENLRLDTQTALLDARWIAGSFAAAGRFYSALRQAITPAAFVSEHVRTRNNPGPNLDTPYVVEPNIKEGRGGSATSTPPDGSPRSRSTLRATMCGTASVPEGSFWTAKSRPFPRLSSSSPAPATIFTCSPVAPRKSSAHLRHAEIAKRMGFGDRGEESAREFISTYYGHSRELWLIYHKIAEACLGQDLRIEPGVVVRSGSLHILDRGLLARDSGALIRLFRHAQSYRLQIHREADDLIAAAASGYKLTPSACRSFIDILASPGAAESLRAMAELGVLQAIVPRFRDLMNFIPGDAAHKFTVGEHSLRAVENLGKLFSEDNEQFTDIFSRIQNLEVLFLATLMHDCGKLDTGRDHSRAGASAARKVAARLGLSEEARDRVEFLVRHHLRMGETARLRDLHQRGTIRDFISVVKDQQLLDMLFLLTVADHSAVGSSNWNQVQVRFLLELHERAMSALKSPHSDGPDIERHRSRVRRELALASIPPDEVDEHCASMPASYLLNTPPDDLAAHIGYVRTVRAGSPAVDMKDDRAGQFTLLTVVARDRQGLLSEIAGVVHAMNIDVHAAQIFTRHSPVDDIAIDILYIDLEGRSLQR